MRRFGIEIECLGFNPQDMSKLLITEAHINTKFYTNKNYGSIGTWKSIPDESLKGTIPSCEVVSPPLFLNDEAKEMIREICRVMNAHGADISDKCALHVHIDVSDCSDAQIINILRRYARFEKHIDKFLHSSRRGNANKYAQSISDRSYEINEDLVSYERMGDGHRWYKVNLSSYAIYRTLEFRQHQGTLNSEQIIRWIEFCTQFVNESRLLLSKEVSEEIVMHAETMHDRYMFKRDVLKRIDEQKKITFEEVKCLHKKYPIDGAPFIDDDHSISHYLNGLPKNQLLRKLDAKIIFEKSDDSTVSILPICSENLSLISARMDEFVKTNSVRFVKTHRKFFPTLSDSLWRGIDTAVRRFYSVRKNIENTKRERANDTPLFRIWL